MFEDFLKKHPIKNRAELPEGRRKYVRASIDRLIAEEEGSMIKHKRKLKPLIIAAVVILAFTLSLITVNGASKTGKATFVFNGKAYGGDVFDYVDEDGFRNIGFEVELPHEEETFAFIINIDAPIEERVRVLTEDTDPEFIKNLCAYYDEEKRCEEAWKNGETDIDWPDQHKEDYGLVTEPHEIGFYHVGTLRHIMDGVFGDESFMYTGTAYGHPSGSGHIHGDDHGDSSDFGTHYDYDPVTETYGPTKIFKWGIYYYVGIDND